MAKSSPQSVSAFIDSLPDEQRRRSGFSLHLVALYGNAALTRRLEAGFAAAGKKLDMGKACIRFKRIDDLPLDVIGDIVSAVPMEKWVAIAQSARRR